MLFSGPCPGRLGEAQSDQWLSDHISIGVLTRVFPPDLVDRVIAEAGRAEVRHRLLSARVVVYYVLGLALFAQASYEEVMRDLVEGLSWASGWGQSWNVPTKAALFKARARLGPGPLKALFEAAAAPLAVPGTRGAWYRGWRLMSIDGTCIDVAETPANEAAFGRPGSGRGEEAGAFPQVRLAALAECGTHALVAAATGACTTGETTLARNLLGSLGPGMLVLADRGFYGLELWSQTRATGAGLLWRTKAGIFPLRHRLRRTSGRAKRSCSSCSPRRLRAAPRVVKRKMSNYGVKRASHRDWPRPARRPEDAS